ncbi:MAG: molybdopterin-dependent oxidoreductase, partial [Halobacteriales archaeon]
MSSLKRTPVPESVDPDAWRLEIDGAVEEPLRCTRADLETRELDAFTEDFDCLEGWTAPGLAWAGIRVSDLLADARPRPEARWGLVHGMDGDYACGLRLDRLADGLLALRLDGEALPVEHGGPARLALPGDSDCWESVKWVSRIELLDHEPSAADTARELALSRIDD